MNENSYAKISGTLSKLNAARENLIHIITNVGLTRRWVHGLTLDMQLPILTGYGRKIKQLPQ